jgi:hypothetical protein
MMKNKLSNCMDTVMVTAMEVMVMLIMMKKRKSLIRFKTLALV